MIFSKEICMKKRIGTVMCLSGILLLIQPDFKSDEVMMMLNYILVHYWPIGLIVAGAFMMNQKQKPRRNKN